jgi:hypothetical protein
LYFRETAVHVTGNTDSSRNNGDTVHQQLLLALESARTRFAVAIAAESKSTPVERWRYYLDTADRVGRFIKKFRKADPGIEPENLDWVQALEVLSRMPLRDKNASHLCRILREIIMRLE